MFGLNKRQIYDFRNGIWNFRWIQCVVFFCLMFLHFLFQYPLQFISMVMKIVNSFADVNIFLWPVCAQCSYSVGIHYLYFKVYHIPRHIMHGSFWMRGYFPHGFSLWIFRRWILCFFFELFQFCLIHVFVKGFVVPNSFYRWC